VRMSVMNAQLRALRRRHTRMFTRSQRCRTSSAARASGLLRPPHTFSSPSPLSCFGVVLWVVVISAFTIAFVLPALLL
jgi:hypothetical protein